MDKESAVIKWFKSQDLISWLETEEIDVLKRWESNLAELALRHKRDTELSWYCVPIVSDIEKLGQKYTIPPRLSRKTYKLTSNNKIPTKD